MSGLVVIDLGYGDGGKGGIVDALTRIFGSSLTVRFSGGPQCSHHVVLPDGRWHGFAQFGSGTFAGARTYLSQDVLIEPYAMLNEEAHLATKDVPDARSQLSVHPDCLVITPWHWRMNRLREHYRATEPHGSCGMGVGEARGDRLAGKESILVGQLTDLGILKRIRDRKIAEAVSEFGSSVEANLAEDTAQRVYLDYQQFNKRLYLSERVPKANFAIFEGSQGVLIDENCGWEPHRTWTDVTAKNALKLIAGVPYSVVGIVPLVMTRHGKGPFISEDVYTDYTDHDNHNRWNKYQGRLRHGALDLVAIRYALKHSGGVNQLAFTKLDKVTFPLKVCIAYQHGRETWTSIPDNAKAADLFDCRPVWSCLSSLAELDADLGIRARYVSSGPTYLSKSTRFGDTFSHFKI